ncbi:MAG: hypothetical protein ACD_37C00149G0001, partial [uncultured bacterium]
SLQSSAREILLFEKNKRITARKINKQTADLLIFTPNQIVALILN